MFTGKELNYCLYRYTVTILYTMTSLSQMVSHQMLQIV